MEEQFGIGELAARFGLATHVLRHWEDEGLLLTAARVGGRRRYDDAQVARVVMILRGKAPDRARSHLFSTRLHPMPTLPPAHR